MLHTVVPRRFNLPATTSHHLTFIFSVFCAATHRLRAVQGAEREVRVPGDLARFANLPMQVISASTAGEGGAGAEETRVLQFVEVDEVTGVTRWQLADVRANSPGKGRKLNKKQRETVIELAVADVRKVNLHVDI